MSKYETYKPSGIDWIGEVPIHWEVLKIKQYLKSDKNAIKTGPFGSDLKFEDLVEDGIKVYNQKSILSNDWTSGEGYITDEKYTQLETCTIYPNDLVITTRGTIGKAAIFPLNAEKGILHPCLMRIQLNEKKCFLPFILHVINDSTYFIEALKFQSNATTIEVIYSDTLKEVKITLPPLTEQLTIANYLDHQTQKIDRLIANKKAQAEKLKELRQIEINNAVTKGLNPNAELKDSGIDWLGRIPKHWEVKRMKDLGELVMGKMLQNENTGLDNLKPYLRSFNVQWDRVDASDIKEMWFSESELLQYRLKKFDIIVSEGGEVGRATIWLDEIDECYIQNSVYKITCNKKIIPYFLLYQFTMLGKAGLFEMIVNKVSIGHLTKEKLVTVKFFVPPIKEQIQIANYLQKRTTALDKLLQNIDAQIEKLQELRKIKIYEAVTGKIKVNAYEEQII